jgi:DNA-directed RNA polymerase subunit RPC12/RpoP
MAKIAQFMEGRYGMDALNMTLFVLWFILEIIWTFSRSWIVGIIVLLVIALMIFRTLSRNIQKRMYENRQYLRFINFIKRNVNLLKKMWRDRKTHRYVKCPYCKAQLRVKKIKGNHKVHCPSCGEDFNKNIIF